MEDEADDTLVRVRHAFSNLIVKLVQVVVDRARLADEALRLRTRAFRSGQTGPDL